MTIISEPISDIAGADNTTQFEFSSVWDRASDDGTGFVTTRAVFLTAVDGVLTTPALDPGPAIVRIGQRSYSIVIPDSPTAVKLWPLVDAGLDVSTPPQATAVINGGGIARVERITESGYAALITPDPETEYSVVPD